eukprot:4578816-Alexandrium_andersonii.AAC.1
MGRARELQVVEVGALRPAGRAGAELEGERRARPRSRGLQRQPGCRRGPLRARPRSGSLEACALAAVSYTHLTLPTICSV